MLGREVRLPSEIMFRSGTTITGEPTSYGDYVDTLRSRMQMAHEVARIHLTSTAQRQKQDYDFKVHLKRHQTGDLVWVLSEKTHLNLTPKLRRPYEGPHLVLKQINDLIYRIQFNQEGKRQIVHYNCLKPYAGTAKLKWAPKATKSLQKHKSK